MSEQPVTATLAAWVARQARAELTSDARHWAYRTLIDHLGAALAGSLAPGSAPIDGLVTERLAGTEATVIGRARRSSLLGAALANGSSAHALDIDDGFTAGSMHPASAVLPAALALGECLDLETEHTLVGALTGVEVACRISAAGHPAVREGGWHNVNAAGVFGATAAACALLGLEPGRVEAAFGLAGSHAGGLMRFLHADSDVKRVHAGKAALDGLICADLAARGATGPTEILAGRDGYFAVFAGGRWDPGQLVGGLGERFRALETYVKPYPGCRHAHSAVDAALELVRAHSVDASGIRGVTIELSERAIHHNGTGLGSVLEAQLNIPFNVAAAVVRRRLTMSDFDDASRGDPAILRLLDQTVVVANAGFDEGFPLRRPATVHLRLDDGREISAHVPQPFGDRDNPLSDEDLEQKFRWLAEPVTWLDDPADLLRHLYTARTTRDLMARLRPS